MEKTPRIAVSSTHRASKRGQRSPKCCQASMVLSRKAAALVGRQCVHNSDWILLHSCTLTVIVVYYTVSLGQSNQFTTCVCVCFFGFLNRLALCIFFTRSHSFRVVLSFALLGFLRVRSKCRSVMITCSKDSPFEETSVTV